MSAPLTRGPGRGNPAAEADRMEEAAHAEAARIVKARAGQIGRDAAALLERGRLS